MARVPPFDDELAAFLVAGNSIVVATRSTSLVPEVTRGTGLRVAGPDRVHVLLPRSTSVRTIENLEANGELAVCVGSPLNFRTVQLKGPCLEVMGASDEDRELCWEQLRALAACSARFGVSRAQVRNLWLFDCWRVAMHVTAVYAQTPGPGAGARMGAANGG